MGPSESLPDVPSADDAPCGLLTTNIQGTLLAVNPLFCEWVGRSRQALANTCRLQDLLSMGSRMFMQTHWMPLMQMQGSIAEVKLEVVRADGSSLPVLMNAVSSERSGQVVYNVAMFLARDRDKYEKELLLAQRRLQTMVEEEKRLLAQSRDRALFAEQMVGIVSHDLRNPLSAIHLGVSALMRTSPTSHQQRMLDRISRSTNRANRLIGDLLDFTLARLGPGLSVNLQPMDPHAAIADAIEELGTAFPTRQLLHKSAGAGSALGDVDRLLQLVGNLVANAVAYGEPGRPITVTSSITESGFFIAVHNFGRPIDEKTLATLFQPMVRGESGIGEASSVGLGLYIVQSIAKAHGGAVTVASSEVDGTTFTATFPAP